MNITLWHAPYNGGWIWLDRKRWRRFACGRRPQIGPDPVLWWCFFGFCGTIILQSWPWQTDPGDAYKQRVEAAARERHNAAHVPPGDNTEAANANER